MIDSLEAPALCKKAPVYDCMVERDGNCKTLKLLSASYAAGLRMKTASAIK